MAGPITNANPAQALSYKTGALTIQRLKRKAQAELGAKFDPRAFHAAVLDTGALLAPGAAADGRREPGTGLLGGVQPPVLPHRKQIDEI